MLIGHATEYPRYPHVSTARHMTTLTCPLHVPFVLAQEPHWRGSEIPRAMPALTSILKAGDSLNPPVFLHVTSQSEQRGPQLLT